MTIPNRGDKQYTDIEKFKKYELTHNICYEMAIRNDEVQTLIKKYVGKYYNSIVEYNIERQKLYNKLMDYFINPISGLHLNYHFFPKEMRNIKFTVKSSFNNYELKYKNENIKVYEKYNDLYSIHTSQSIETFSDDGSITTNNILLTPIYSRPSLSYSDNEKTVAIRLNLAMPKKELIDFIERLKYNYDKDHKTIISISELLGEELMPFQDIIFNTEKNIILDRKTKKQMRATSFTSHGFKMADILFIYDCLALNYNQQKIKYLLAEYYATQNKRDTIDDERYRRYVAIGKDFIDNKRYKELFLGTILQ